MNAEEYFLQKFGNKITASESWVIRFAEEYAKIKQDEKEAEIMEQLNCPKSYYIITQS